jgi:hypothetical protein
MKLECRVEQISKYGSMNPTPKGVDEELLSRLASEGWQLVSAFNLAGQGMPTLGVFYRKHVDPVPMSKVEEKPTPKRGRPKKDA